MILVTGGAGYIGSHCCLELLNAGFELLVVDNLCNSSPESLKRVEKLTGRSLPLEVIDLTHRDKLQALFKSKHFDAVLHFAGLKAVGESVEQPLRYYQANIIGTLNLLECMVAHDIKNLVFSSSATVYGEPKKIPVTEDMPLTASNPYGRTKLMIEDICRDLARADSSWRIALLRYFNPVGAHQSGEIGEAPQGIPNNLMPYLLQVVGGRRSHLTVFGNDYPTRDGTGVRDYIHVVDLAKGHVKALQKLSSMPGCVAINLGANRGVSVLEMIEAMRQAAGRPVPYQVGPRRPGDSAEVFADASKAKELLGWTAEKSLDEMCRDGWRWQQQNPLGYESGR